MKLILLGAPGSGKGTVAEKLVRDFKLQHISMGELLRQEIKCQSALGRQIKETIEKGNLVPDHLAIEIVRVVIKDKNNYILDGFPRTAHQAKDSLDLKINKVLYLEISAEEAVNRISGRRVCEKGTHTYHIKYISSKKKGICDIDGTKLIQRKDDQEAAVRERFKVYAEKTKPLVDFYKKEGLLARINAAKSPEEVYQEIKKALDLSKYS